MFVCFCIYFVCFFCIFIDCKNTNKYKNNTKNTEKYTLYFWYFSITSKNALCILYFLYVSINSQIALCPFVFFVLLTCPQRTKPRIHQCVLYVPFVDDFAPLSVAFFLCHLGLYFLYF